MLPLLWAAFEGEYTVNDCTFSIIPKELKSAIISISRWVEANGVPDANLVEKIALSIQSMGDQLVVVPLVPLTRGRISGGDAAAAATAAAADVDMTGGNAIETAVTVADEDMQELEIGLHQVGQWRVLRIW